MSHIARVGCQFKNLDALGEACARKNAQLVIGQKTFKAWSRGTCEHAIKLLDAPGSYEVGVVRSLTVKDAWDLQADLDMGAQSRPIIDRFGRNYEGLQNEYLAVVAAAELRKTGAMVQEVRQGERIELRAYA